MEYLQYIFILIVMLYKSVDVSSESCQPIVDSLRKYGNVYTYKDVCYVFINHEKTWVDARHRCEAWGGDLVHIPDQGTMQFIKGVMDNQLRWRNNGVWIGLHNRGSGGWRWTTGQRQTFNYWDSGQPSKTFGFISFEDCACMRRGDGWRWHDYMCDNGMFTYKYICQFRFGITKVLQSYNHIQNVIYSMLTGRTVVIIGSSHYEEEVKNLVTALKLFLPGCHRCQTSCIQWSSKAIAVTDLIEIKLIGICRHEKKSVDRMVPKAVQGSLITTILSRKKSFKTEEGYIQFIKVSLCEFSSKAFIFFHSFCLGTVGTLRGNRGSIISESDSVKKTATAFLSKLGIQDCDIDIMEYLTELVKYQHIEDHYKSLNTTGIPPRPFTRNIHPCQLHRL
ncbi:Hypothetical predicted protein [Mytilus galloprovincialis]|uniref:C-type lectin domain-containing protein n=1 Tax=Mytilus galloprovincialis TaxID=29158 RepID=A0A8B6G6U3_MYTGA|nr:Hypothetical predicted protein [Mytilus galloprovincialis]